MSRGVFARIFLLTRFPRVSGDEPRTREYTLRKGMFSPRERG